MSTPSSTSGSKAWRQWAAHAATFCGLLLILATATALLNGRIVAGRPADVWLVHATPGIGGGTWQRMPDLSQWLSDSSSKPRVLILGPSTACRGIVPTMLDSALGVDAFNAGGSSQTTDVSERLLRYAFAHTRLRYVVLDFCAEMWDDPITEEDRLDVLVNNPQTAQYGPVLGITNGRVGGTWLYYTYKRWLLNALGIPENVGGQDISTERYAGKGFVYSGLGNLPTEPVGAQISPTLLPRVAVPVRRMQALCEAHGCRLFVLYPKVLNLDPAMQYPSAHPSLINAFYAPLDDTDFYDARHLRAAGARINTAFLIAELRKRI